MDIRFSEEETWKFVEESHTAIFTSLRKDGQPITLPVWFVVKDRLIVMRTPYVTAKVRRVKNDQRGCFLVERGLAWRELRAVMLVVTASLEADPAQQRAAHEAINQKYADFSTPVEDMPQRTRDYMTGEYAYIKLAVTGKTVTWDNRRIPIGTTG